MKITLVGTPIPKNRHQCGCSGKRPYAYDPQSQTQMKVIKSRILHAWNACFESPNKQIALEASNLLSAESFSVSYVFAFPVPDSATYPHRNAKLWGWERYAQKPDLDNLEKLYTDCGTGILWKDDAMITEWCSKKVYSENPRTEITIMALSDFNLHPKAKGVLSVFGPQKLREFCNDITAFWAWPASRIDEVVADGLSQDKEQLLFSASCMLMEFAEKYADDLKKILKYRGLMQDECALEKGIRDIEIGNLKV